MDSLKTSNARWFSPFSAERDDDIARDHGYAVIMVTHDPRVEDIADRIMWLEDGAFRDRMVEMHQWARDLVCGMRVVEWKTNDKFEYKDEYYVFCSQCCREQFKRNPMCDVKTLTCVLHTCCRL